MNNEITFFAQTTFRNQLRKFGIKLDDRRRHMYLIGKTGMGKSTILENMIVDDIRAGHGVAVVDPHGDLAEKIIEFIPPERVKDVIYFNPADTEFPIAFNVVEQVEPQLRHLVASGLIGVFQKLWADSWGPRLEYILRNAILAILDYPGSTLLGVVRILSDKAFRKKVVANINNPTVKAFWEKEFASYADKFASEAVAPIQNKVGQFLSTAFMRNIVGQTSSALDMRQIMDEGKILIMNLSKGRIGEDNSALLGAMMITKIQLAAMSRVNIPEKERKDFFLYIDEFQNFSTDSFANILSEARKYHLCLIMAHQYIEQLDEKVSAAVFGNVGTMIVFRVGATDAEFLVKELTPVFTEEDIVNLPKYEMYLKLMIDGISSDPFSAKGLPPLGLDEKTGNVDKIIEFSRATYASSKADVEIKILHWHEDFENESKPVTPPVKEDAAPVMAPIAAPVPMVSQVKVPEIMPPAPLPAKFREASVPAKFSEVPLPVKQPSAPLPSVRPAKTEIKNDAYKFEAVCSGCGQKVNIPFQPDGIRPVFCKACLEKNRARKQAELEARQQAKQAELQRVKTDFVPFPRPSTPVPDRTQADAPKTGGFSLSSLKEIKPVDFRGREINIKPAVIEHNLAPEEDDKEEVPSSGNSGDLREGQEVKIS